ncbi:helix-turn-helix domain-containing protein [Flavobacterium sp. SM15]|uniref:helix-turn-helix domain-containing protein n=1 Tax=Flavobacterium sp. SM15 TaxID=2908005 RepID=UPI001EDB66BE|nr:helix-turn-helix transcriptional regulator [Flavobacterium sp. SM15]MCG2610650.1 helix-turn-helix domain-containing protein [Flavobacterium sp. SM15]
MEKRVRKKEMPAVVIQLGIKLKDIIEAKKLKQREVAYDAGMDVENLRKYMKGNQEMKISTLIKISEALGMTASELLDGLQTKNEN